MKNACAKEGTTEKAATVVSSTWDVIYNPETTLNKIKMAAAKENGAKSKGLASIWNLYYLHEYVHDIDVDGLDNLRDEMQNLIVKFRGATGWRSADLTGVFLEHSITWVDAGENTPNINARESFSAPGASNKVKASGPQLPSCRNLLQTTRISAYATRSSKRKRKYFPSATR